MRIIIALSLLLLLSACNEGFKPASLSTPTSGKIPPPTGPGLGDNIGNPGGTPTPTPPPIANNIHVCQNLRNYTNGQSDASSILQTCIDGTPQGHILELPRGKFRIARQISIKPSITIRTEGKTADQPRCSPLDSHDCAELFADNNLYERLGMIVVYGEFRGTIDHIVVNGNKSNRMNSLAGQTCSSGATNQYGFNAQMYCSDCKVTNSVFKNALCGTSLGIGDGSRIEISKNTVTNNGIHTRSMMWADGITVGVATDSDIIDNNISDNTDVDLIFGGCVNCRIQRNNITHTSSADQGSFAGLMIYMWPGASTGNYTGSDISNNTIDCGSFQRCGFGLYVGIDAWTLDGNLSLYGGFIHDNRIRNAQQGFAIDKTTGEIEIANNIVENSGGRFNAACGPRNMTAYSIDSQSFVNRSRDSIPASSYARINWDGCIPNWWTTP